MIVSSLSILKSSTLTVWSCAVVTASFKLSETTFLNINDPYTHRTSRPCFHTFWVRPLGGRAHPGPLAFPTSFLQVKPLPRTGPPTPIILRYSRHTAREHAARGASSVPRAGLPPEGMHWARPAEPSSPDESREGFGTDRDGRLEVQPYLPLPPTRESFDERER